MQLLCYRGKIKDFDIEHGMQIKREKTYEIVFNIGSIIGLSLRGRTPLTQLAAGNVT